METKNYVDLQYRYFQILFNGLRRVLRCDRKE